MLKKRVSVVKYEKLELISKRATTKVVFVGATLVVAPFVVAPFFYEHDEHGYKAINSVTVTVIIIK
jgi:hypothetical protein